MKSAVIALAVATGFVAAQVPQLDKIPKCAVRRLPAEAPLPFAATLLTFTRCQHKLIGWLLLTVLLCQLLHHRDQHCWLRARRHCLRLRQPGVP